MSNPRSEQCAQVVEWLTELLPVWEVPVTVSMIQQAIPDVTKATIAHALKHMTEARLLYGEPGQRDQTFYFPEAKRKRCAVQEYLCKGRNWI